MHKFIVVYLVVVFFITGCNNATDEGQHVPEDNHQTQIPQFDGTYIKTPGNQYVKLNVTKTTDYESGSLATRCNFFTHDENVQNRPNVSDIFEISILDFKGILINGREKFEMLSFHLVSGDTTLCADRTDLPINVNNSSSLYSAYFEPDLVLEPDRTYVVWIDQKKWYFKTFD